MQIFIENFLLFLLHFICELLILIVKPILELVFEFTGDELLSKIASNVSLNPWKNSFVRIPNVVQYAPRIPLPIFVNNHSSVYRSWEISQFVMEEMFIMYVSYHIPVIKFYAVNVSTYLRYTRSQTYPMFSNTFFSLGFTQ